VSEYSATTGEVIKADFITGLSNNTDFGLVVSGNTLFVANSEYPGRVGAYNATTGAAINADFITGLDAPLGLAVLDDVLFVAEHNRVGTYNATTGAAIDANFINANFRTGLGVPLALAVLRNTLFVATVHNRVYKVRAYNATTGEVINADFITGLTNQGAIAVKRETPP
jgi:outer membrane protein assembly factor BamB